MEGSSYSDLHRMYLQGLMSRAIVSRASATRLLKEVALLLGYRTPIRDSDVSETIAEINRKISEFGQEIKEIRAENNGEELVCLVNLVDNSTIFEKINHPYTVKEREVFRLLLEATVMAGTYGSVATMDALHLNVPNMKAGDIQDTIDKLQADKWFIELDTGRLVPAPRLIAEFDQYLKTNFHDHVNVCLCNNVVFYGVQCPHCDHISHRHCFITFNRRQNKIENKCPSCKANITDENDDDGGEETPQQNRRGASSQGSSQPRKRKTPGTPDDGGEETTQQNRRGASSQGSSQPRKGKTPETPINTPACSSQEPADASEEMDTTPVPTRGRRKRRSDQ